MTKPLLVLDQHFRRVEELFSPAAYARLNALCHVEGGQNWAMDPARVESLIGGADFYVAAKPALDGAAIDGANNLKAIIEVAGAFQDGLDYAACFDKGVEVLSCSPGFRESVAEMGLAMILAGGRGLVQEHEAFRSGNEHWLKDWDGRDFTLYGQEIGFLGYGQISRELHRLLAPFSPKVSAFDPWLKDAPEDVALRDLDTLLKRCRVVVVAAVPTAENAGLLSAARIARMRRRALLVLLSRAHCIDFDAALAAARKGEITFATDVFPEEPVDSRDPMRAAPNVIYSPHRAAAVESGRHLIGQMIVADIEAILAGRPERRLQKADRSRVASLIDAQRSIRKAGTLAGT
ncbi:MAG: NAD(P)-dependent oxidoreductase [Paracoccaceae bacterium]|nr:NAD(P)-dependent oxidoreductase [Paracoccaceae bacterium]